MSKYVFNKICQPGCSPDFLFYPCFQICPPSSIKIENGVLYIVDLSIFTWLFKLTPSHLLLQLMTFSCIQNKSIRVATVVRILCLWPRRMLSFHRVHSSVQNVHSSEHNVLWASSYIAKSESWILAIWLLWMTYS